MKVPVRKLKANLSHYLAQAQRGREVVVTSRGRAIVRLSPAHDAEQKPSREEVLRRLDAIPGIRIGKGGKPKGATHPIVIKPGEKTLAELVIEGRR